jgi:hypothetical protein
LILVTSVISCSNYLIIILGLITFVAAAYRLFLFTATAHGTLSSYLLLKEEFKSREFLNIISH